MDSNDVRRGLSAEMLAFRQQIDTFIQSHWPSRDPTRADMAAWRAALVAAGWSVPHWPQEAGGTDWDATQLYLWRQACAAAGIPLEQDAGVELVGPILLRYASSEQQALYLPGIRALRESWAIAFAEPGAGIDHTLMQTKVVGSAEGWRLQGEKCWVAHAQQAQWLCCLAYLEEDGAGDESPGAALLAVPADAPGVTCTMETSFDGSQHTAAVQFQSVLLPPSALLARAQDSREFAHLFVTSELSTLSQSAVARAQLEVLDAQLQSLDPADDLHTQRAAVAVELQALEALELRYLDARQKQAPAPYPIELLRLRSREILLKLGALQVESFGYYALPYPDEMLLHNEGPIGPDVAAASVRQNLTQHVAALYAGSAEALKDVVWDRLHTGLHNGLHSGLRNNSRTES